MTDVSTTPARSLARHPLGSRARVLLTSVFGPYALWSHGNYGIHGTNQPELLTREWRYFSAGCTRNTNENILWLWPRVPVGTPVRNIR